MKTLPAIRAQSIAVKEMLEVVGYFDLLRPVWEKAHQTTNRETLRTMTSLCEDVLRGQVSSMKEQVHDVKP